MALIEIAGNSITIFGIVGAIKLLSGIVNFVVVAFM